MSFAQADIRGVEQRYGRLRLVNTFGPETHSLRVPIQAEYFHGNGWTVNTADTCTNIALTESANQIRVKHPDNAASGAPDISALLADTQSAGPLDRGRSQTTDLILSAPGEGNRGEVSIGLNPDAAGVLWPDHLNIDWDQNGIINSNDFPEATATFGLFRGNDRMIHWREVLGN